MRAIKNGTEETDKPSMQYNSTLRIQVSNNLNGAINN